MKCNSTERHNPIISHRFPEYELLTLKSKAALNTFRASLVTTAGSLLTASIGVGELDQGALTHNHALQATGHQLAEIGTKGLIGSVAAGAIALVAYVELSSRDEEQARHSSS
jgi:hypothetical protein